MLNFIQKILSPSPNFVKFDDKVKMLLHLHPTGSYKKISSHYGAYGSPSSAFCEIYFDKFLIDYTRFRDSCDCKYFNKNEFTLIRIYLIDDKFEYDENFSTFSSSFCYPEIYADGYSHKYVEGPWMTDLKNEMAKLNISKLYLSHVQEIDNAEKQKKLDYERQHQCCENKRNSVLKNYK